MKKCFAYSVAVLVWGVTFTANAQVYRCTTPGGATEYSQLPCGKDAQLLLNRRDSIDTKQSRSPLDALREKEAATQAENSAIRAAGARTPNTTAPQQSTRQQIDYAACDRADRDAKIEANHARQNAELIRRKQKLADWECGRDI